MLYNWQQSDWPEFRYGLSGVEEALLTFAERTGRASGLLKGLTPDAQVEATIEMMAVEALKTSAIEGELLSRKDVMSSIRHNLGMDGGSASGDKRANGAAALMIDVRNSFGGSKQRGRESFLIARRDELPTNPVLRCTVA